MNRPSTLAVVLALALFAPTGARPLQTPPAAPSSLAFEGTWTASGERKPLPTETGRDAAIVQLSGALVLSSPGGLARGFHAQAIGFDDGVGVRLGRALWVDDTGDRLFSTLTGDQLATGARFSGTITGGTGRYVGLTGEYAFTWQYVVGSSDGAISGRAVGFKGTVRR